MPSLMNRSSQPQNGSFVALCPTTRRVSRRPIKRTRCRIVFKLFDACLIRTPTTLVDLEQFPRPVEQTENY